MKTLKNDPSLAELPPPITLTLDQLSGVAAETGASLGGGLVLSSAIIAGGIWWQLAATVAVAVQTAL